MDSGLRRNDGRGLQAVGLAALYLAPRRYFASRGPLQDRPALLLAAALVGITDVMDYIDQNIADAVHAPQALAAWTFASWGNYWLLVLLTGPFSAVISWYLFGWWYRKRLEWRGAGAVARQDARAVNALQSLVYVLPIMVWAMVRTLIYPGYAEAQTGTATSDMVLLVFLLWSCWTSYCAATTVYTLDPRKARFWFLLLPLGFCLMVLSASGTLYATLT